MKKLLCIGLTILAACFNQSSLANLCRATGVLPHAFSPVNYQQCKDLLSRCHQKNSPILSPDCVSQTLRQASCKQFNMIGLCNGLARFAGGTILIVNIVFVRPEIASDIFGYRSFCESIGHCAIALRTRAEGIRPSKNPECWDIFCPAP